MEITSDKQPRKGAIAICSLGRIGIITSEKPEPITYPDGNTGVAWLGRQLSEAEFPGRGGDADKTIRVEVGTAWSSRAPLVLFYLEDLNMALWLEAEGKIVPAVVKENS